MKGQSDFKLDGGKQFMMYTAVLKAYFQYLFGT